MDFVTALATASAAMKIAREIKELDAAFDKAVLKSQMVDLMDKLADVKGSLIDIQEEVRLKDAELARLRDVMDARSTTIEKRGFRYKESPETPGEPYGYPFCPRCDEVDGRLVSTVNSPAGRGATCPQCKQMYVDGTRYLLKSEMSR